MEIIKKKTAKEHVKIHTVLKDKFKITKNKKDCFVNKHAQTLVCIDL